MAQKVTTDPVAAGKRGYEEWRDTLLADPENRRLYDEVAAERGLWLDLVDARHSAGLTQEQLAERLGVSQAQVARIEKRGYNAHTLKTLRRYVAALGDGFALEVRVLCPGAGTAQSSTGLSAADCEPVPETLSTLR